VELREFKPRCSGARRQPPPFRNGSIAHTVCRGITLCRDGQTQWDRPTVEVHLTSRQSTQLIPVIPIAGLNKKPSYSRELERYRSRRHREGRPLGRCPVRQCESSRLGRPGDFVNVAVDDRFVYGSVCILDELEKNSAEFLSSMKAPSERLRARHNRVSFEALEYGRQPRFQQRAFDLHGMPVRYKERDVAVCGHRLRECGNLNEASVVAMSKLASRVYGDATLTCVQPPKTATRFVRMPWPWTCAVAARRASWKRCRTTPPVQYRRSAPARRATGTSTG
jgi:hypothetical protein